MAVFRDVGYNVARRRAECNALLVRFAQARLFVVNGLVYVGLGLATGRFRRKLLPIRLREVAADVRAALMGRLFGTDGLRGLANGDLTPELALAVSVAVAHVLAEGKMGSRPVMVVGRDPHALFQAAGVSEPGNSSRTLSSPSGGISRMSGWTVPVNVARQ